MAYPLSLSKLIGGRSDPAVCKCQCCGNVVAFSQLDIGKNSGQRSAVSFKDWRCSRDEVYFHNVVEHIKAIPHPIHLYQSLNMKSRKMRDKTVANQGRSVSASRSASESHASNVELCDWTNGKPASGLRRCALHSRPAVNSNVIPVSL